MNIRIEATATLVADVYTVDDLREFVAHLNKHGIEGDREVELGAYKGQHIYVTLTGDNCVEGDWIECGDHIPFGRFFDVIIPTHGHGDREGVPGRG